MNSKEGNLNAQWENTFHKGRFEQEHEQDFAREKGR